MSRFVPTLLCLLALLGAGALTATAAGLQGNPANDARLLRKPIEAPRYDEATHCKGGERKGTRALASWLGGHFRGVSWGSNRCEKWGPGSFSIHAEGRALDWHLDARRGADRRSASRLIDLLLSRDRKGEQTALARRMGIQGLIWNCRQWFPA